MVPAAIPAASVSARAARRSRRRDAPRGGRSPLPAAIVRRRTRVRDRRRRATRASTPVVRASRVHLARPELHGGGLHRPLDRVALGAFVSISVRADATPEAAIDALVAVVRVHAPGEVRSRAGSENPDGSISCDPWSVSEALMPPGSYVVDSWATGSAVRTPARRSRRGAHPPSTPWHGLPSSLRRGQGLLLRRRHRPRLLPRFQRVRPRCRTRHRRRRRRRAQADAAPTYGRSSATLPARDRIRLSPYHRGRRSRVGARESASS